MTTQALAPLSPEMYDASPKLVEAKEHITVSASAANAVMLRWLEMRDSIRVPIVPSEDPARVNAQGHVIDSDKYAAVKQARQAVAESFPTIPVPPSINSPEDMPL